MARKANGSNRNINGRARSGPAAERDSKGRYSKLHAPLATPAPTGGKPAVPHVATFQSLVQTISGKRDISILTRRCASRGPRPTRFASMRP